MSAAAPRRARTWLTLAWLAAILGLALLVHARLRISGDLRQFMPTPRTRVQRLLLDEVSTGPAARLLLVELRGAGPALLADSSRRLAAALRGDPHFGLVENGEERLEQVPAALLPYRYLLSPTLDHQRLDAAFLGAQLAAREQDLASPAGSLLEPLLPRDPTLEVMRLLQAWQPARQARILDGVWFDTAGAAALLLVQTTAPGFDPQAQRAALAALRARFATARANPAVVLEVTGPGAFAVLMQGRSEHDARLAGSLDSLAMAVLMLLAYRAARPVLLGALPLLTAGVAGMAAVALLFGTVHGITLAFGFTLTGVALDYPIYLFSSQRPGIDASDTAREIWPTLATAVLALCIAFLAFAASGVEGLAQLACFNIAGLAAAGLCTRYLLPPLLGAGRRDCGAGPLVRRLAAWSLRQDPGAWPVAALALAALAALVFVPGPRWDNDLGHLTPVPATLLRQYDALRHELGSPDVRWLLAVDGADADQVLRREERLAPQLQALAGRGAIGGYDCAARYLPSSGVQEHRRAALPDGDALRAALAAASAGRAFRPGLFEPFLTDVARARALPPLTARSVAGTPLELPVGGLLLAREGRWTGLVTFTDVADPGSLARLAAGAGGAMTLLDLKQAAEDLVGRQRQRIEWCVAAAALVLAVAVGVVLRSARRAARVLTPMALAALLTLALLHALGAALNLFHLVALVLAAGLGLDYALFLERSAGGTAAHRRALHAVLVCAAAAGTVFVVLASSSLPVLRAIGTTVVLGVAFNLLLALWLVRPQAARPQR